jgi:hypothetical protein
MKKKVKSYLFQAVNVSYSVLVCFYFIHNQVHLRIDCFEKSLRNRINNLESEQASLLSKVHVLKRVRCRRASDKKDKQFGETNTRNGLYKRFLILCFQPFHGGILLHRSSRTELQGEGRLKEDGMRW